MLADWDQMLRERNEVEEEIRTHFRDNILAHNQTLITNVLTAAAVLVFSISLDVVALRFRPRVPYLLPVSGAVFAFAFVPFFGVFLRLAMAFASEVLAYQEEFKARQ